MAFIIKSRPLPAAGPTNPGVAVVDQWIHVAKAAATVPQSTAAAIFTVRNGRVLVKALIGEVTTAIGAGTTPDLRVNANPTTGTTYILASDLVIASDEVGTLYSAEGDGTALLTVSSGAITTAIGQGFVVGIGDLEIETSESTTGATKWDVWYLPLDSTAGVIAA